MKCFIVPLVFLLLIFSSSCNQNAASWKAKDIPISSKWGKLVNPDNVWQEYPRPQFQREEWINLNGLWDFEITAVNDSAETFNQNILVPFPVESSLSGIRQMVGKDSLMWYRREINIPSDWENKIALLNFEASDWQTRIWVNEKFAGEHKGGYDPFTFEITDFIKPGKYNDVLIQVWDPTDKGPQPRGKQVSNPGGIFYTPSSGIWQTVWMEAVKPSYIQDFRIISDIDREQIEIYPKVNDFSPETKVRVKISDQRKSIIDTLIRVNSWTVLNIPDQILWTPENPFLYDLKLSLENNGEVLDEVNSYFGMRKISLGKDENGFTRMMLNNEFVFQNGPLDQGFWPEGLHTPPSDEAMKYDIEITRELGFNMLRKHVKVENRRYYYWCDKLGILVWQDMPSAVGSIPLEKIDSIIPENQSQQFRYELKNMIESKFNHPSIVVWVPYNESWGQFNTPGIVNFIYSLDSTRLVNNASGWHDCKVGDLIDYHHYPDPVCPPAEEKRANVLGEFGGLGFFVEGNTWQKENWGYKQFMDVKEMLLTYESFYTRIWDMKNEGGLSAAVYTQITDVETETNGLLSYDREVIKMDKDILEKINTNNYVPSPKIDFEGLLFYNETEVPLLSTEEYFVTYTLDSTEPTRNSTQYTNPVKISTSLLLKTRAFSDDDSSFVSSHYFEKFNYPPPEYLAGYYSDRYTANGIFGLIDKVRGTENFRDGKWQGFQGEDLELLIDLNTLTDISRLGISCFQDNARWIFLPTQIEFFKSENKRDFVLIDIIQNDLPEHEQNMGIKEFILNINDLKARYIKLVVKNISVLPDWHNNKGNKAWMFIDEIILN
ncbi:sugar-binding domain-containing protein [Bacteroidota bacterium]